MATEISFTKKDIIVASGCVIFLLMNLGAIGSAGRKRAKEAVCLSNLRQFGAGFSMYAQDNDGQMVLGWGMLKFGTGDSGFASAWYNKMQNYVGEDYYGLWCCPVAQKPGGYAHPGSIGIPIEEFAWSGYRGKNFYIPDTDPPWDSRIVWGSYCLNLWATYYDGPEPAFTEVPLPNAHWRGPSFYKGASAAPILTGGIVWNGLPHHTDMPPVIQGAFSIGIGRYCMNRHNGKVNGLFLDFSARSVGLKELWTLKWHRYFDIEGPYTAAGGMTPVDWEATAPWMADFTGY